MEEKLWQQLWQQTDLPSSAVEGEVCWNAQVPFGAHVRVHKQQLACTNMIVFWFTGSPVGGRYLLGRCLGTMHMHV